MRRIFLGLIGVALIVASFGYALWLFGGGTPSTNIAESHVKQDAGEGGVTATVIHYTPQYLKETESEELVAKYQLDKYHVFEVRLDTHSVDLSQYNLMSMIVLKDDKGHAYSAVGWEPLGDHPHHRSGIMKFPTFQASSMELVIYDVAGVKARTFRWSLTP